MAFMPTDEPIFFQFLIFYESFDCFRTAKTMWKDVTQELNKSYDEPALSEEDETDDSMMTASVDEERSSGFNESFDTNQSSILSPSPLTDENILKG